MCDLVGEWEGQEAFLRGHWYALKRLKLLLVSCLKKQKRFTKKWSKDKFGYSSWVRIGIIYPTSMNMKDLWIQLWRGNFEERKEHTPCMEWQQVEDKMTCHMASIRGSKYNLLPQASLKLKTCWFISKHIW